MLLHVCREMTCLSAISYHGNTINSGLKLFYLFVVEYSSILGETGVMATQTVVTEVAPSPDVVWVGTVGGHLLAFHPVTMDVLLVQRRQLSINSIVCLGRERLAVFGEGVLGEGSEDGGGVVEVDKDSICGLFTIWTSYIGID